MPKVIKKKSVKKKTVHEEGVKSVALQTVLALKKKQKQVTVVVSSIIAVFVLFVAFSLYSSAQYKKAYTFEMDAYQYYYGDGGDESLSQEERWKKALELYQQSVDIKATPTALFYLGNSYFNLGDYENAIKQYTIFTDKFSRDKGILPLVYQKLASSYFQTGQNEKALDLLGRLRKVNGGIFKDTALVYEARYYESAGESVKALDTYRELIAEFPSSPWAAEANAKISASEVEAASSENKGSDAGAADAEKNEQPAEKQQSEKQAEE